MINNISYNPYVRTLDNSGNVINKNAVLPTHSEHSCANMSFRDLVETVEAAQAEQVKKCNSEIEQVGVADLSKRTVGEEEHYKTGDTTQDMYIRMGMDYKASCFDFRNAGHFASLTAEQEASGFEGMSNSDKYKAIYEKYQYCYGESFLDAAAIDYVSPPLPYDKYMSLIRQFNDEVNEACGGAAETTKARREALYGDMSDVEIRAEIMESYSENGKITQRNLFKAANEMSLCGVDGGLRAMLNPIGNPFAYRDYGIMNDPTITRENQLDMTVTADYIEKLEKVYENRLLSGGYANPEIVKVLGQIMAKYVY